MYLEAVGVEADCVEGLYNLGLVNLKLSSEQEAYNAFDKLQTILPSVHEAVFQLGNIYERRGGSANDPSQAHQQFEEAAKTFEMLLNKVPGDANLCSRLGLVYEKMEDENVACHWQTEAHRHYPVNLNVISWLGVWYVKREMYEQAIEYFERASLVQPGEVKWQLMVTSCHRRLGDLYKALELYQKIHEDHPENVESLQYLEALCKDLGRPHDEYTRKLDKLRRAMPAQTQATGKFFFLHISSPASRVVYVSIRYLSQHTQQPTLLTHHIKAPYDGIMLRHPTNISYSINTSFHHRYGSYSCRWCYYTRPRACCPTTYGTTETC